MIYLLTLLVWWMIMVLSLMLFWWFTLIYLTIDLLTMDGLSTMDCPSSIDVLMDWPTNNGGFPLRNLFAKSLCEVSHGGPVAALGVSSGAALQQLATQKLGVTEVEDQLLMMPGGAKKLVKKIRWKCWVKMGDFTMIFYGISWDLIDGIDGFISFI